MTKIFKKQNKIFFLVLFLLFSINQKLLDKFLISSLVAEKIEKGIDFNSKNNSLKSFKKRKFIGRRVYFLSTGDILLDRGIRTIIERTSVFYPFNRIRSIIQEADIAFCNLETSVSLHGKRLDKAYAFRSDPSFLTGLTNAGFNICSLANNHTLDYGREAFTDTIQYLQEYGIVAIGGGKNQSEACKPKFIKIKNIKFAFLGFVDLNYAGIEFDVNKPAPAQAIMTTIIEAVKKAKKKANIVIVSFHWGIEYQAYPNERQIELAHKTIESGADIIIGHHPHVLQGIERYRGAYIFYSMGNFIFDQKGYYKTMSLILRIEFKKYGEPSISIIPIRLIKFLPQPLKGQEANTIIEYIKKISYNVEFFQKDGIYYRLK